MDKQVKTAWLKALRGGRYKQGKSDLVNESGEYCCLGVLARIQGAKKEEILNMSFLDGDLAKYAAGLRKESQNKLANMNDGVSFSGEKIPASSFLEIADYIEKKYK